VRDQVSHPFSTTDNIRWRIKIMKLFIM
jgi:hypothetical protein